MALLEKPAIDVHAPLTEQEVKHKLNLGKWLDTTALKVVVQDTLRAENYEATKQWVMQWPTATTLYQSPFTARYWEGTQTERANVPFFTVATAVESLVPQIIKGLFYENPPFMIQKRPGTTALAARAIGDLLAFQLEDINFQQELRYGVKNCVLYGTGIWKWGWETFTRERKIYRLKSNEITLPSNIPGAAPAKIYPDDDDIEEEVQTEYIDRPVFEHLVNLRHLLVDPGLNVPDVRKAKYVVHRQYLTWEQLDKLRDRPGYTIPSKEEMIELFLPPKEPVEQAVSETSIRNPLWDARAEARYEETTVDPFNEPLEVLERWDEKSCIVVLQKKLVICNDDNPYGVIPFLSIGWWDVPEAFWSMGLAKTIGSEQRLQQGITNIWLDNASLNLQGVYTRVIGKSVPTQSIRIAPGKIVNVENKDDFAPLKRTDPVPEAEKHLAMSAARAEQTSGASEFAMQGVAGQSGHSNLARTAAGANLMAGGTGSRVEDFIEKLSIQVFMPFLYVAHEMNRAMLPMSTLRYILDEELEHEYMEKSGDMIELINARVKFSILAGAKMAARRAMAQALPTMIQFLTSEQTTQQIGLAGYKIDVRELMTMMFEVSDWRNVKDVIVKMTPEEQQRWQQQTPAAQMQAKAQMQSAAQDKQFQQKQQLLDQENIGRAARDSLRQAYLQTLKGQGGPAAGFGGGGE